MERVYTLGKMADDMKASTRMIENMARGSTPGLTGESTWGSGRRASSTEKASTDWRREESAGDSGKMASALPGSTEFTF